MNDVKNTTSAYPTTDDSTPPSFQLPKRLISHLRLFTEIDLRLYLTLFGRFQPDAKGDAVLSELAGRLGLSVMLVKRSLFRLMAFGLIKVESVSGDSDLRKIELLQDLRRIPESSTAPVVPGVSVSLAARVANAVGDQVHLSTYEYICDTVPASVVQQALTETLAVPLGRIRKSRSALFFHLVRKYAKPQTKNSRD